MYSEELVPSMFYFWWAWLWPVSITALFAAGAWWARGQARDHRRRIVRSDVSFWEDILHTALGWPLDVLLITVGAMLLLGLWPLQLNTRWFFLMLGKVTLICLAAVLTQELLRLAVMNSSRGSWLRIRIVRESLLFAIYGLATVSILGELGFTLWPAMIVIAIGLLGLALAGREILVNLLAGLQLDSMRGLRRGDIVQLENGASGELVRRGALTSYLRAADGTILMVPNHRLTQGVIGRKRQSAEIK